MYLVYYCSLRNIHFSQQGCGNNVQCYYLYPLYPSTISLIHWKIYSNPWSYYNSIGWLNYHHYRWLWYNWNCCSNTCITITEYNHMTVMKGRWLNNMDTNGRPIHYIWVIIVQNKGKYKLKKFYCNNKVYKENALSCRVIVSNCQGF